MKWLSPWLKSLQANLAGSIFTLSAADALHQPLWKSGAIAVLIKTWARRATFMPLKEAMVFIILYLFIVPWLQYYRHDALGDWSHENNKKLKYMLTIYLLAILLPFFLIEWPSKSLPGQVYVCHLTFLPGWRLGEKLTWIPTFLGPIISFLSTFFLFSCFYSHPPVPSLYPLILFSFLPTISLFVLCVRFLSGGKTIMKYYVQCTPEMSGRLSTRANVTTWPKAIFILFSWYWAGISLKWRPMQGNIIKKRLLVMSFVNWNIRLPVTTSAVSYSCSSSPIESLMLSEPLNTVINQSQLVLV